MEYYNSFRKWLPYVWRRGWAVVVSMVSGTLGFWQHLVDANAFPIAINKPPLIPAWAWFLVAATALLYASFHAFHVVRVERDALRSQVEVLRTKRQPGTELSQPWREILGAPTTRHLLIDRLRGCATEYTNVGLIAFPASSMPIVQTLRSVFEMAGWETGATETPQESFNPRYVEGIQVRGFNKHLVDAVTQSLAEAGLSGVHPTVEQIGMTPENPKYRRAQQRISITIGHQD